MGGAFTRRLAFFWSTFVDLRVCVARLQVRSGFSDAPFPLPSAVTFTFYVITWLLITSSRQRPISALAHS